MSDQRLQQVVSSIPQSFYEILAYYTASVMMWLCAALLFLPKDTLQAFFGGDGVEPWLVVFVLLLPLYAYGQTITLLAWLLVDVWVVTPFVKGLRLQDYHAERTDKHHRKWKEFPIPAICRAVGKRFSHRVYSHSRNKVFLHIGDDAVLRDWTQSCPCPPSWAASMLMYRIRLANEQLVDTLIKEHARCDLAKSNSLNALLLALSVLVLAPTTSLMDHSLCGPWLRWWWWPLLLWLASLISAVEYYFRRSRTHTHVAEAFYTVETWQPTREDEGSGRADPR